MVDEKDEPEAPKTADEGDECTDEDQQEEEEEESRDGSSCKRRKVVEEKKPLTKEEDAFVRTLDQEIDRFNDFFLEKEEE